MNKLTKTRNSYLPLNQLSSSKYFFKCKCLWSALFILLSLARNQNDDPKDMLKKGCQTKASSKERRMAEGLQYATNKENERGMSCLYLPCGGFFETE